MDINLVLQILTTIFTIVFGFIALYLRSKEEVVEKVSDYIAKAEEDYKDATNAGGEKFNWVVDQLYDLVPGPFKMFLTKEVLGVIVQYTFDSIAKYTTTVLDKKINSINK